MIEYQERLVANGVSQLLHVHAARLVVRMRPRHQMGNGKVVSSLEHPKRIKDGRVLRGHRDDVVAFSSGSSRGAFEG